jgi:hypothetical protein
MAGEIGSHDGYSTAEEAEGRSCHALVFNVKEARNAALFGLMEKVCGRMRARGGGEVGVGAAGDLLTSAKAQGDAIGVR